jgi:prolyl-tRNA editing enzyme YbaK/EbsC (Cys-tRNA(Pro) deacylase)
MHERAEAFAAALEERYDLSVSVQEFPDGTKTAADAAAAIGCETAQIASSLVFLVEDEPVVAVVSGANRVDESALASALDRPDASVGMADPDRVREATGYAIGGVPPLCHDRPLTTLFDRSLLEHETVWAAAGTPQAVFPVDPERLVSFSGATVADLTGTG